MIPPHRRDSHATLCPGSNRDRIPCRNRSLNRCDVRNTEINSSTPDLVPIAPPLLAPWDADSLMRS